MPRIRAGHSCNNSEQALGQATRRYEVSAEGRGHNSLTAWMSMPLVKRSDETRLRQAPFRKSWKTRLRCDCSILAWM